MTNTYTELFELYYLRVRNAKKPHLIILPVHGRWPMRIFQCLSAFLYEIERRMLQQIIPRPRLKTTYIGEPNIGFWFI